ncbi:MAG: methylenetetrahydrofolate reductase [NAD(P)H] [Verrucomicrobiota bacterium]|jgi:methylenetetrahydrofolate reductase (NADPH)|nr:methylenetetrahydrofolate reductase [NAD(P)H] [Verrucomicrobiota bacterium]MDP7048228.1 methylenetetrahydrofolate reductase [NAD(P)H] [Verrucomicrobiota bacterium]
MRFIRDIHAEKAAAGKPTISFEFFPFKTPEGEATFFGKTLPALMTANPDYASVTYGAGGSTREKTLEIVEQIQNDFRLTAMAHLTCIKHTQDEIDAILDEADNRCIQNILALRGDPPPGEDWSQMEGGFEFASELVTHIRSRGGFGVAVAGFPEGHIDCSEGREVDWQRLVQKIDCGADMVITQMFFHNADYFRLADYLDGAGMKAPLFPGIIPVANAGQVKKFSAMCGAKLPKAFAARLDELGEDAEAVREYGIEYATAQCRELLDRGVPGLHFYTLNKSKAVLQILGNLGLA